MSGDERTSFSTWAILNPIPPIVLFLVLTVAGLFAFAKLPVNNMPAVVIPVVMVNITQPGAAATEIETQITRKVEGALAGMQGVKRITSTLSEGSSSTTVEFHIETDFDRAVNDTRDAVSKIRDQLPRSIEEPQVERLEIDGGAILVYSFEAPEMSMADASWYIDDTLSRELLSIRGVASVKRSGGVNQEITLTLDPQRLMALGASAAEISRQLAETNIDLPGGRISLGGNEYSLRTLGSVQDVNLIRETYITLNQGQKVKLSELGTITLGPAEIRSLSKLNDKPAIVFEIYRSKGASEVDVEKKVIKKLESIAAERKDIKFTEIFSLVTLTKNSYKSTLMNFFEGAVLTILVVFLFLKDKRATFIAALAIPLSIIPTFLCMYWLGFSLNAVSLLAIALVTGVLVDDAIVEIENIHRHMQEGKTPYQASIIATNEIGLAVVATTLVICAVFVPVSFMGGVPGQFFKQFGLTVAIAAFFSLMVARLITPMLAAYILKKPEHHDEQNGPWIKRYTSLVSWTLDHRIKTLGIAFLTMALSFGMIPFLSTGFIPYEDYSQSSLTIELPVGTTIRQTEAAADKVTKIIRSYPEVLYVLTSIDGDSMSGGVNKANIQIKLTPPDQRQLDQRSFENVLLSELKKIPDMRINFANSAGGKDVTIALLSEDAEKLTATASAIETDMRGITGLSSVGTTDSLKKPEIIIAPDFAKAAELGISVQAMSEAIRIATIGDNESSLAKFNLGNRQIPIRVRLPYDENQNIDSIKNLQLRTNNGNSVALGAVADIRFTTGPTTINRLDRQRTISLEANLNGIPLGEALKQIYALPSIQNMPKEVKIKESGDAEVMEELFAGFMQAIGAGLLMVYAIQVLLYKDWIQPFTRMAALPLSIGGAFIMLLLTGTDLSMPALIGILMLMGIADKNSILLVDYMLELIHKGVPRRDAILEACRVRARPIIMTSLAMLAGMMPIALGFGLDTAFRAPMAIAVIGGLISSTALSLVFVPMLFSYVRDFEEWLAPRLKKVLD